MHCPTPKRTHRSIITTFLFLFSVVVSFSFVQVVLAQTETPVESATTTSQTTLTAIPPRLGDDGSLTASPGEVLQDTVRVRNTSDKPLNILSSVHDFVLDVDGSTPIAVTDQNLSNRWSLASWITIAPNLQTIQPNETKIISVIIAVPDDALPGGHYAMITHQPSTEAVPKDGEAADTKLSATGISQRVGTLLYVNVKGAINESAFVRSFNIPKLTEYGPVPYSFTIENQSDIHIQPGLMLEFRDMLGRKVDQVAIESKNIFPLTERRFEGSWEKVWGTGRYTATVTMNYGSQGAIAIAKTSFWLFPFTLVVAALLTLLVLLAMFIAVRRHMIHRKTDQSAKIKELEEKLSRLESK
jgi:hypothetical protein